MVVAEDRGEYFDPSPLPSTFFHEQLGHVVVLAFAVSEGEPVGRVEFEAGPRPLASGKVRGMSEELRGRLPVAEFGFPGELRDRLVPAILAGKKTATTGLL